MGVQNDAFRIVRRLNVIGGAARDGPRVKIDIGIPREVGDARFFRTGEAVVVGDLFHGSNALSLGAGRAVF